MPRDRARVSPRARIVERSRDLEERLTDLTTIYLGFGILTTNNAYRYRTGRDHKGSSYSHAHTGYLSPQDMALLLALQMTARGADGRAHKNVAKRLETNQAAFYRAACGHLREHGELVTLLELPERTSSAREHVIDLAAARARRRHRRPPEDADELAGAPPVLQNLGRDARAVPARIDVRPIALAAALGMAVAALVALLLGVFLGPAMAGGAIVGAIVGAVAARRERERVCNLCGEPVDDTPACRACGARLQA